jgi:hypothetical protein
VRQTLSKVTLDEKIGQMITVDINAVFMNARAMSKSKYNTASSITSRRLDPLAQSEDRISRGDHVA